MGENSAREIVSERQGVMKITLRRSGSTGMKLLLVVRDPSHTIGKGLLKMSLDVRSEKTAVTGKNRGTPKIQITNRLIGFTFQFGGLRNTIARMTLVIAE